MIEGEKLRKADIVTSVIIVLFGLWVCFEAFKMPMKDSWGGVMNVWYVSPALFPLIIGLMLIFLGIYLFSIAIRTVGLQTVVVTIREALREKVQRRWITEPMLRFLAIVSLLIFFVYMNIPRIDFFLSSLLFLVVFIVMFYYDDMVILRKLFTFYLVGSFLFLGYFATNLDTVATKIVEYATDILALVFIVTFSVYARMLAGDRADLRRKYRIAISVALCVPFVLCPIFKYFLLVPLPAEGMIVALMDALYYSIF